ncbi:hypothetical protein R1flu_018873 [Riccia fluitans]|uniref:Uncharacterized protein n=1 Tax=Riccia fluitans TaxID=41844 RepID=A0ABD1ZH39_9MARC
MRIRRQQAGSNVSKQVTLGFHGRVNRVCRSWDRRCNLAMRTLTMTLVIAVLEIERTSDRRRQIALVFKLLVIDSLHEVWKTASA